jgi:hypothetical protein
MKTRPLTLSPDQANRLVGLVHGHRLERDAGPEGCNHYFSEILGGEMKIADTFCGFSTGEEFIENVLLNDTPNEIARKLVSSLLGERFATPEHVREHALRLVHSGLPAVIEALLAEPRNEEAPGASAFPA